MKIYREKLKKYYPFRLARSFFPCISKKEKLTRKYYSFYALKIRYHLWDKFIIRRYKNKFVGKRCFLIGNGPSINNQELSKLKNFEFIHQDINDKYLINKIIDEKKIDCVINLAAKAGVRKSVLHPYEYYQTNLLNTLNILEILKYS